MSLGVLKQKEEGRLLGVYREFPEELCRNSEMSRF